MNKKEFKKYCKFCEEQIPINKTGPYRDYCGYFCYMDEQGKNKKITDYFK